MLLVLLMAVAFAALFHPDDSISMAAAAVVLIVSVLGVLRHRQIAPLGRTLQSEAAI